MSKKNMPNAAEKPLFDTLDDAIVLGQEVAELKFLDRGEMGVLFQERTDAIVDRLSEFGEGQLLTYSGIGYVAMNDFHGERVTVHKKVEHSRGKLVGLKMAHRYDFEFYEPLYAPGEVGAEDGDLLLDFHADDGMQELIRDWESELVEPPENYRLFLEFLVDHQTDFDYPVAGSAVVADSIKTVEAIDVSTLELHDVSPAPKKEYFSSWCTQECLEDLAQRYRKNLKSNLFRRASANEQMTLIEHNQALMNAALGMERFSMCLNRGNTVLIPSVVDGEVKFEEIEIEDEVVGQCLSVDCLVLQLVKKGVPYRKGCDVKAKESLCVLVEIDKEQADFHGFSSTIVWVPILPNKEDFTLQAKPAL